MTGEVTYIGADQFTMALSDQTASGTVNWRYISLPQSVPSGSIATRSTAEWIEEAPKVGGVQQPLANFGSVTFTNMQVTISGGTMPITTGNIDDQNYGSESVSMTGGSQTYAAPSALNSAQNSFAVAYGSSAPSAPTTGPDISYDGPIRRSSLDSGAASAVRAPAPLSPIASVALVVEVPRAAPMSPATDRPAQAVRPGTSLFTSVLGRKLPQQGSRRSPFSSPIAPEDGF